MTNIPRWSSSLSVRNARLDEQHILLIELCKEMVALVERQPASDTPILESLREFAGYVARHHALEEEILQANQCPTFDEHCQMHRAVDTELSRLVNDAETGSLDRKALVEYFGGWVAHHLTEMDMPVKTYLHDQLG